MWEGYNIEMIGYGLGKNKGHIFISWSTYIFLALIMKGVSHTNYKMWKTTSYIMVGMQVFEFEDAHAIKTL